MKKCYADPSLGVSKGEFEAPSTPMTIDLSCEHRVAPTAPISEEEDIEETVSEQTYSATPDRYRQQEEEEEIIF